MFTDPISFPYIFPCPSFCIIMFLGHPALNVVILSRSSTVLRHSPPLFCFILQFIIFCCTSFYLIVLCSSLLFTSSLTCPCPLLHY
jgi:hypothetical protein